jgi:hypothetical protein
MKLRLSVLVGLCLLLTYPATSQAQLNGHNTRGDYGLMSGTQLPVGNYALGLYYDYSADTLRDSNGDPRPTTILPTPCAIAMEIHARRCRMAVRWT